MRFYQMLSQQAKLIKRKSWNLYEGWKDVQCLIKKEKVEEKESTSA